MSAMAFNIILYDSPDVRVVVLCANIMTQRRAIRFLGLP